MKQEGIPTHSFRMFL